MTLDYRLASSGYVEKAARSGWPAVIPLGSLEQHCMGPLGIDGLIAERLAYRACSLLREREGIGCLLLPTIYYGFSPEWAGVPGTITLQVETFKRVIRDIMESLYRSGFRRVAFINGHGGNSGLLEASVREASLQGVRVIAALIDYWRLIDARIGHASMLEEAIAKGLGLDVDFGECQARANVAGKYKIIGEPAKATARAEDQGVEGEDLASRVIEGVYKALRELVGVGGDSARIDL